MSTFVPAPTAQYFDNISNFSGQFTAGEAMDFITVNLTAGSKYNFLASGTYQVSLSIYDAQGYLLMFTDGDDVGVPDPYPQDSILGFKPDYTGTYKIAIYYSNVKATGVYVIAASEDILSNGKNDRINTLDATTISNYIQTAIQNILRIGPTDNTSISLLAEYNKDYALGLKSYSGIINDIVAKADATTSVATLSYQFFTGHTPSSPGYDYLVSPVGPNGANLNSAYYQTFNIENRYINFAVNLGKNGEGKASFTANYGSLSLTEATTKAYATIFGVTPTAEKVSALLSGGRDAYLASYGGDGLNGIGTKAAMVGWLLAEAEKANIGMYARSNSDYLIDLSDGASYGVDLVAAYGDKDYGILN